MVTLLFFMVIAITITSGAIVVILVNSLSANKLTEGERTFYVAESGMENALIRLLRDPNYQGETMIVDDGTATINVTGNTAKTIKSVGQIGNFSRTIQVSANYINYVLTVTSWQELF